MDSDAIQDFIRQKSIERHVNWSRHALSEVAVESFTVGDVEFALQQAKVIEEYPLQHRFLPDCLTLAFIVSGQPIHCVIGINEPQDYILIVTVYQPNAEEWEHDWRTRK
jgi:hypothetical protein